MDARNSALTIFGRNEQTIISGIPPEEFKMLIDQLDQALDTLSLTEAEKEKAIIELTRTKADLEATVKIVSGFLRAITREEIPPDQFAATFFNLVAEWNRAGERIGALGLSRNLTPQIASLREAAQKAHAEGDLAEASRLYDEIDRQEMESEQRLLDHRSGRLSERG